MAQLSISTTRLDGSPLPSVPVRISQINAAGAVERFPSSSVPGLQIPTVLIVTTDYQGHATVNLPGTPDGFYYRAEIEYSPPEGGPDVTLDKSFAWPEGEGTFTLDEVQEATVQPGAGGHPGSVGAPGTVAFEEVGEGTAALAAANQFKQLSPTIAIPSDSAWLIVQIKDTAGQHNGLLADAAKLRALTAAAADDTVSAANALIFPDYGRDSDDIWLGRTMAGNLLIASSNPASASIELTLSKLVAAAPDDEATIDERIGEGVRSFAREGSNETIPARFAAADPNVGQHLAAAQDGFMEWVDAGLDRAGVEAEINRLVAGGARTNSTDKLSAARVITGAITIGYGVSVGGTLQNPTFVLTAPGTGGGGGGLDTAAVDARILLQARAGNADRWPLAKLITGAYAAGNAVVISANDELVTIPPVTSAVIDARIAPWARVGQTSPAVEGAQGLVEQATGVFNLNLPRNVFKSPAATTTIPTDGNWVIFEVGYPGGNIEAHWVRTSVLRGLAAATPGHAPTALNSVLLPLADATGKFYDDADSRSESAVWLGRTATNGLLLATYEASGSVSVKVYTVSRLADSLTINQVDGRIKPAARQGDSTKWRPDDLLASPEVGKPIAPAGPTTWQQIEAGSGGGGGVAFELVGTGALPAAASRTSLLFAAFDPQIALPTAAEAPLLLLEFKIPAGAITATFWWMNNVELRGLTADTVGGSLVHNVPFYAENYRSPATGRGYYFGHDSAGNLLAIQDARRSSPNSRFTLSVWKPVAASSGGSTSGGGLTQAQLFDGTLGVPATENYHFAVERTADDELRYLDLPLSREALAKDPKEFIRAFENQTGDDRLLASALRGAFSVPVLRSVPDAAATRAGYTPGAIIEVQQDDVSPSEFWGLKEDRDETIADRATIGILGEGDSFDAFSGVGSAVGNEGVDGAPIIAFMDDLAVSGVGGQDMTFGIILDSAGLTNPPEDLFLQLNGRGPSGNSQAYTFSPPAADAIRNKHGYAINVYTSSAIAAGDANHILDEWAAGRPANVKAFTSAAATTEMDWRPATEVRPGKWVKLLTMDSITNAPVANPRAQTVVLVEQSDSPTFNITVEDEGTGGNIIKKYRQAENNLATLGSISPTPSENQLLEYWAIPSQNSNGADRQRHVVGVHAGFSNKPLTVTVGGEEVALTPRALNQPWATNVRIDYYHTAPISDVAVSTGAPATYAVKIELDDDSFLSSERSLAKETITGFTQEMLAKASPLLLEALKNHGLGEAIEIVTTDVPARADEVLTKRRILAEPGKTPLLQYLGPGVAQAVANRFRASGVTVNAEGVFQIGPAGVGMGAITTNTAADGKPFIGYIHVQRSPNTVTIAVRAEALETPSPSPIPTNFFLTVGADGTVNPTDADPVQSGAPTIQLSGLTFKIYTIAISQAQYNAFFNSTDLDFSKNASGSQRYDWQAASIPTANRYYTITEQDDIPPQATPNTETDETRINMAPAGVTLDQDVITGVIVGDRVSIISSAELELSDRADGVTVKLEGQQQGGNFEDLETSLEQVRIVPGQAEVRHVILLGDMTATVAGELTVKLTASGNAAHSSRFSQLHTILHPKAR